MTKTSLKKLVQSCRQQITQGEIELVLDRLQNYLSASAPSLLDEVILLTARYNRLHRDERKGIVSREGAQVEQNRLNGALLDLLEEIPDQVDRELSPISSPEPSTDEITVPQEAKLEKILGVNNLKQISWIKRGLAVSKSVCRILTPAGLGTGFLIAPDLVMTNHHVIPDSTVAAQSVIEFNYQHDFAGNLLPTCRYKLNVTCFQSNSTLDYTIVGVLSDSNKPKLDSWGHTLLNPHADPIPGEHVVIIQRLYSE